MLSKAIFLLVLLMPYAKPNDSYENSTNLCNERCNCELSNQNLTLRINCANKNMKHIIADWPVHPKNLIASFSNNNITTLEQMPGSGAENIQLFFSNCGIKYLNSGLFESTVNVRLIDLSHNVIQCKFSQNEAIKLIKLIGAIFDSLKLSPDVFKGPYNDIVYEPIALEHLDLSYNLIHSLQRKLFVHTPNLKHLNLEGNSMRIIDHATSLALSSVTQMQVLNLANNRLTELPSDAIKHFPNLTEIDLSQNRLDFVPDTLGFVANSLEKLNISFNPIIEINHNTFEGFGKILHLSASNLQELTMVHAKSFAWLKNLQIIELCHNENLLEIDEEAFGKDSVLKEAYLHNNGLEKLSVKLLPWNQLEVLDIKDNNLLCDCDLYNISRQLPDVITKYELDVPLCVNPRSFTSEDIFSLTEEWCSKRALKWNRKGSSMPSGFKSLRITLTVLIIVLLIMASAAMWLGYAKWKLYKRNLRYTFPNQVMYSPIQTFT